MHGTEENVLVPSVRIKIDVGKDKICSNVQVLIELHYNILSKGKRERGYLLIKR